MFDRTSLHHLLPEITPEQETQLAALSAVYEEWNARINVISRKDIGNLFERHILHSLCIARFAAFQPDQQVLDVGTGGGFPGIPLAIVFPQTRFLLVDSVGKKLKVAKAAAGVAGLENVRIQHERVEKLQERFDHVVSRAVTSIPEVMNWIRGKAAGKHSALWYLRGLPVQEEMKTLPPATRIHRLTDIMPGEFFSTKALLEIPLR
ncbi:MAG: 16S rRNA (guanine(527)-N(7))-methyltransferase RsmG [Bacteroidia bacterium]|nr:16S rRNA (guanine(527)-N(7))-methyltransferase RsmG [Bacteroidia bacterium]